MKELTSYEEFIDYYNNDNLTIFVFSANWCPDCHFIKPFMPDIVAEFNDYEFVLVDRDKFIEICKKLDIFGIPSFVAVRSGNEVGRFVSTLRKTKDEITEFLGGIAK